MEAVEIPIRFVPERVHMSGEKEVCECRVVLKQFGKVIHDGDAECQDDGYGEMELTKNGYRAIDLVVNKLVCSGKASKGYYDCEILDESTGELLGSEILVA